MIQPRRKLLLVLPFVALTFASTAQAQGAKGVLVRLETTGQKIADPPIAHLQPSDGGEALAVTLTDDGVSPDVEAGDGIFAGAAMVEADSFDVSVTIAGAELQGGPVAWAGEDQSARDLIIRYADGGITVVAGVPQAAAVPVRDPTATTAAGAPTQGAAPANGGSGSADRARSPGQAAAAADTGVSRSDALLWMALGLGLIGLALAGGLITRWLANRSILDLPVAPEPPILGPGTPSLSEGLSVWQVAPDLRARVIGPLLSTLARDHRVLLAAPPGVTAPPVFGGPVHLGPDADPAGIEDALVQLAEDYGSPLALLLVLDAVDVAALGESAANLPPGVGGVALVVTELQTALPKFALVREEGRLTLQTPASTVSLRATRHGFEVARTA